MTHGEPLCCFFVSMCPCVGGVVWNPEVFRLQDEALCEVDVLVDHSAFGKGCVPGAKAMRYSVSYNEAGLALECLVRRYTLAIRY